MTEAKAHRIMNFAQHAGAISKAVKALGLGLALAAIPAAAQVEADPASAVEATADNGNVAGGAAAPIARMKPTEGVGMPVDAGIGLQDQYTSLGNYSLWIHDAILIPIITIISLFVLFLLIWVVARYNRRANPVASRTSHNTVLEVAWTLIPVLILVGIAVPSIDLLAKQFKPAPDDALTVKITGNQWFWTYSYPDNGEFEVISYMLNVPGMPEINPGKRMVGSDPSDGPGHFEVDNRLVLPVGETIRLQITAADVIHSFAVPSLWAKLDAVPGRINEMTLKIDKPGVYYGQCSELCGPKHAFMPIAVEALPRDQFEAWVRSQPGGTVGDEALSEEDAESAQDALEAGDGAAAAEAEASTPAA